jgi:hypothetical protein
MQCLSPQRFQGLDFLGSAKVDANHIPNQRVNTLIPVCSQQNTLDLWMFIPVNPQNMD